jgi:hypothetical protein
VVTPPGHIVEHMVPRFPFCPTAWKSGGTTRDQGFEKIGGARVNKEVWLMPAPWTHNLNLNVGRPVDRVLGWASVMSVSVCNHSCLVVSHS